MIIRLLKTRRIGQNRTRWPKFSASVPRPRSKSPNADKNEKCVEFRMNFRTKSATVSPPPHIFMECRPSDVNFNHKKSYGISWWITWAKLLPGCACAWEIGFSRRKSESTAAGTDYTNVFMTCPNFSSILPETWDPPKSPDSPPPLFIFTG